MNRRVTNRRLTRRLMAMYPRAWRDRYGPEVAALTDDLIDAGETTPLRAALNLIAAAAIERARVLTRPSRAALAPTVVLITAMTGITLAITYAQRSGGTMKPYFQSHGTGLLMIVVMGWLLLELSEFLQVRQNRQGEKTAAKPGAAGRRLTSGACLVLANTMLYLAPPIIPGATIRPGAVAFTIGMTVLLAGIALRLWSFTTLGRYFSYAIVVNPDQPVVSSGPYRIVRHPSYTGGLLAYAGIGMTSANWVGLAAMTLPPIAAAVWRIHAEENALLTVLGHQYRSYATGHKRLIPLVW